MSRSLTFAMYFLAIFLQAGAYGLTFMLPRLFANFGASEKVVGAMVFFRLVLVKFKGGKNPYITIALLQYVMAASVVLFIFSGDSIPLYIAVAILFGLGYGASYPILVAMAANDAEEHLGPQTLQIFALTYFIGIFAFPLLVGWMIVEFGHPQVLVLVAVLAIIEATMALRRAMSMA